MLFLFFAAIPSETTELVENPLVIVSGDWNEQRTAATATGGAFYAGGFNPQAFYTAQGTLVIVSGNWSQTRTATAGARGQGITIASGDWNEERAT